MPRIAADRASCRLYTFKEGALSAVGHDLILDVGDFRLTVSDDLSSIEAVAGVRSIEVLDRVAGRIDAGSLSDEDKREIRQTLQSKVLEPGKYPEARFHSSSVERQHGKYHVNGTLEIDGRERAVDFDVVIDGDRAVAKLSIDQRDFGIEPYRALLGALRVQPVVKLEVSVPYEE